MLFIGVKRRRRVLISLVVTIVVVVRRRAAGGLGAAFLARLGLELTAMLAQMLARASARIEGVLDAEVAQLVLVLDPDARRHALGLLTVQAARLLASAPCIMGGTHL